MAQTFNRKQLRHANKIERRLVSASIWPIWEWSYFPKGSVGCSGWLFDIDRAAANQRFAVLIRRLGDTDDDTLHLAIRTPSHAEPRWAELQRIKDELCGPERCAVQVCPARSRLIDDADMYHLWVMPSGFEPAFGLHPSDGVLG
jgi:hypothetical protein